MLGMTTYPLFAQAGAVEGATSGLLQYGLLGIFCVLLIGVVVWTARGWVASMEARIRDAKDNAQGLKGVNDAASKMTVETSLTLQAVKSELEAVRSALSTLDGSNARAIQGVRESLRLLEEDIERSLGREREAVQGSIHALREELSRTVSRRR